MLNTEEQSKPEQLSTEIPGDITPVPTPEPEPTAERLPSKKTRYSSKKEIEKLKAEFDEYKEKVERDFKDIDENLEEHFPKLYKEVDKLSKQVKTVTREIKKVKNQVEEITEDDIPSKTSRSKEIDEDDDGRKSPFERSPGLLSRITQKLKDTDGKMSIKDVLSTAGKETKKYAKEAFDPLQIARALSLGSDIGPTLLGKLTGRSTEDIEKYTSGPDPDKKDTATKVSGGMDSEYEVMTDILTDIYDLMQKSNEEDKIQRELDKDFEQSKKEDKEKKHKELLDAIKSIGIKSEKPEEEKDDEKKEEGGGIVDTITKLISGAVVTEALASVAAVLSPILIPVLGAAALGGLMLYASKSENLYGAVDPKTGESTHKHDLDTLNESGIGSDEETVGNATASKIKENKIMIAGEEFTPGKPLSDKQASVVKMSMSMGNSYPPEVMNSYEMTMAKKSNSTETAKPSSSSSSPKPSASPTSSSTSSPSAAPAPSPNKGSELNTKVSQNQDMKLAADAPAEPKVINNSSSSSSSTSGSDRVPIPSVRPFEDTFGRLSTYATRTV
jgi:uncharacterized membrane-anchored protein YhcB (DUF1043 family)